MNFSLFWLASNLPAFQPSFQHGCPPAHAPNRPGIDTQLAAACWPGFVPLAQEEV